MASTKSERAAGADNKQATKSKAAARQERLAAQLRENLKKRKAFARARKTSEEDTD